MIEKRIIKISPSGLNGIQTCFRQAYYHRVLGYDSPDESTNEPMNKGSLIHKVLELYYNSVIAGISPIDNIKDCIQRTKILLAEETWEEDTKQHVTNTLMEYFGFYQNDSYKPLLVEQAFSYELFEDDSVKILLEGKVDLVAERVQGDGETLKFVFDHKSRGKTITPILLQNQYPAYALALGINNVVDNEIGMQTTKSPKDKFKRRVLSYSEEQLEEWAQWTIFWVLQFDASIQRGVFPPNFKNCYSCDFRSVCESEKEYRIEKLERFFVKRTEDFDIFNESN